MNIKVFHSEGDARDVARDMREAGHPEAVAVFQDDCWMIQASPTIFWSDDTCDEDTWLTEDDRVMPITQIVRAALRSNLAE